MIGGGGVEPGSEYSAASGPPATAGPQADDRLISVHFSPKDLGPSLSLWAVVRPRWRPNRRSEWWKRRDGGRLGEGPPSPSGWVPKGTASGKEGKWNRGRRAWEGEGFKNLGISNPQIFYLV
ncbi:hypothetical protein BHM03_00001268 [Ensete ventricosum]|nr:hypothetical protein BHM03_00001268 [Ensete ventricosum]